MYIEKVIIQNYKCFDGKFSIEFKDDINILVGNNEAGKSTILEAINLALTGILGGRYLRNELSQYLFNRNVVTRFICGLNCGENPPPPKVIIEVFLGGGQLPLFEGNWNSEGVKKCGLIFKIELDPNYQPEYEAFVSHGGNFTTIPIEYYYVNWKSCSRDPISSINIPIKSVLIDSASNKYQNGSDVYISRIIRNDLDEREKVQLSQAYRRMKESFMGDVSIQALNQKISTQSRISEKDLSVSVDLSTQNSWETTLMTYLNEVPFHQVGKGEQCIIKTNLALGDKKSQKASLILLEEPENHLSHTKLNELIKSISDGCVDKQVIISTHSSFVANKLGLERLLLLNKQNVSRLCDLSEDTFTFFRKLPGYQTLRLLLSRKAILVEGDSDELIFQKAYMESHGGHLPIEDGIDVISVKLTFKRFLEIATKICQPVAVITDNDGDFDTNIARKYEDFLEIDYIRIFADDRNELNTLEPQFVDANRLCLDELCEVVDLDMGQYDTPKKISDYMQKHKTDWSLKVFLSDTQLHYPEYIKKAVAWCDE